MMFWLWDILRLQASPDRKKVIFEKESGVVTPELRQAYEFYQKNVESQRGCEE